MEIADLRENLLVQTTNREVLKISTIYPTRVTAQVVYPLPERTTVREFPASEVETWCIATDAMIAKYEAAWGFR